MTYAKLTNTDTAAARRLVRGGLRPTYLLPLAGCSRGCTRNIKIETFVCFRTNRQGRMMMCDFVPPRSERGNSWQSQCVPNPTRNCKNGRSANSSSPSPRPCERLGAHSQKSVKCERAVHTGLKNNRSVKAIDRNTGKGIRTLTRLQVPFR